MGWDWAILWTTRPMRTCVDKLMLIAEILYKMANLVQEDAIDFLFKKKNKDGIHFSANYRNGIWVIRFGGPIQNFL